MKRMHVAIACGGTGGHLFPGLAVGEALRDRGVEVSLLISPKDVDQEAVRSATGMEVVTLPAVAMSGRRWLRFLGGLGRSNWATRRFLKRKPAQAVLGMGGFTSVAPILAGRASGAAAFLHESNTIPGRANRWLSKRVDCVFVGFSETTRQLRGVETVLTGTPVRRGFRSVNAAEARRALGLEENRPVLLVMGGSQGAEGINRLVREAAPRLAESLPYLQIVHLSGLTNETAVREAYSRLKLNVVTRAFLREMEQALAAATVVISRAGASSLAEIAAVRVPSILIPYPSAMGNHQYYNARAFADSGAALLLEESDARAGDLVTMLERLLSNGTVHRSMQEALTGWDAPKAAELIVERVLRVAQASGLRGRDRSQMHPEHSSTVDHTQSVAA